LYDGNVTGIELCYTSVCINGVSDLVVAALIQASKVKTDFGDVRVDADGTRVSVEGVTVLTDLKIEYVDGAPEGRIATVPVDSLLVSLVSFVVLLTSHVGMIEKIPALCIRRIYNDENIVLVKAT
jgi:hypothetical protein